MGHKATKSRQKDALALPTKAYRFLDDRHLKTRWFEIYTNVNGSDHYHSQNTVSFLHDESYIIRGSIYKDPYDYAREQRQQRYPVCGRNGLSLLKVHPDSISASHTLQSQPARDLALSPSGDHIAVLTYNGYSSLEIWSCEYPSYVNCVKTFRDEKLSIISHSTCCAFSRDEKYIVIAVCSDYFTMERTSHLMVQQIDLSRLSLGKYGKSKHIHFPPKLKHTGVFTSLEFSPNGNILAVGSSYLNQLYRLFIMCTKSWNLLSTIRCEIGDNLAAVWGVFRPCSDNLLFICTPHDMIEAWTLDFDEPETVAKCYNKMKLNDSTPSCKPVFSSDGNMLAIGLSNGWINVINPDTFTTIQMIMHEISNPPNHQDVPPRVFLNCVTSISFSKSCQYLLAGHGNGSVAITSLPPTYFTLKHFCRTVIISNYSPAMISELPIPNPLKRYLLYQS